MIRKGSFVQSAKEKCLQQQLLRVLRLEAGSAGQGVIFMFCDQCGFENPDVNTYCFNDGALLRSKVSKLLWTWQSRYSVQHAALRHPQGSLLQQMRHSKDGSKD